MDGKRPYAAVLRSVSSRTHPAAIFYLHPKILILSFGRQFSLHGEKLLKEIKVTPVFFATGAYFHTIEKLGTGEGNRDTVDLMNYDTLSGFLVRNSRRACHEVDKDFVSHTYDWEFGDITGIEFAHAAIGQRGQRVENAAFVFRGGIDEEIHVAGISGETTRADGEASHHQEPCTPGCAIPGTNRRDPRGWVPAELVLRLPGQMVHLPLICLLVGAKTVNPLADAGYHSRISPSLCRQLLPVVELKRIDRPQSANCLADKLLTIHHRIH